MSRIDGMSRSEYSVKILNNKIYWGFAVNWATFYLRINIYKSGAYSGGGGG